MCDKNINKDKEKNKMKSFKKLLEGKNETSVKIGKGSLVSKNGKIYLYLHDKEYGPEDKLTGSNVMAGSAVITSDDLTMKRASRALHNMAIDFVKQSNNYGKVWSDIISSHWEDVLD